MIRPASFRNSLSEPPNEIQKLLALDPILLKRRMKHVYHEGGREATGFDALPQTSNRTCSFLWSATHIDCHHKLLLYEIEISYRSP